MCCGNYRFSSLCVGWLNIVCSILSSIYYMYKLLKYEQIEKESVELVESDESVETVTSGYESPFENKVTDNAILFEVLAVFLWLVPSILLVIGIKQNRHRLVALWLFISYLCVAINSVFFISMCWVMVAYTGSYVAALSRCLPVSIGLVFWILCLHPVRKFYKIMSIPPPVLPTHCNMETTKPEEDRRYMPLFDN